MTIGRIFVGWLALSAFCALVACGAKGLAAVPSAVDFSVCVLDVSSRDEAAGVSAADAFADVIAKCGGAAVDVARVLEAHKAAMVRESHHADAGHD